MSIFSSLYILHILVGFVLWVGFLESCRARGYLNPSPITHFCQVDQYRVERCLSLSLTCIVRWQLSLAHLLHASVLLSHGIRAVTPSASVRFLQRPSRAHTLRFSAVARIYYIYVFWPVPGLAPAAHRYKPHPPLLHRASGALPSSSLHPKGSTLTR